MTRPHLRRGCLWRCLRKVWMVGGRYGENNMGWLSGGCACVKNECVRVGYVCICLRESTEDGGMYMIASSDGWERECVLERRFSCLRVVYLSCTATRVRRGWHLLHTCSATMARWRRLRILPKWSPPWERLSSLLALAPLCTRLQRAGLNCRPKLQPTWHSQPKPYIDKERKFHRHYLGTEPLPHLLHTHSHTCTHTRHTAHTHTCHTAHDDDEQFVIVVCEESLGTRLHMPHCTHTHATLHTHTHHPM